MSKQQFDDFINKDKYTLLDVIDLTLAVYHDCLFSSMKDNDLIQLAGKTFNLLLKLEKPETIPLTELELLMVEVRKLSPKLKGINKEILFVLSNIQQLMAECIVFPKEQLLIQTKLFDQMWKMLELNEKTTKKDAFTTFSEIYNALGMIKAVKENTEPEHDIIYGLKVNNEIIAYFKNKDKLLDFAKNLSTKGEIIQLILNN